MPTALLVSGARAPQYRLGHVPPPEPSDEQFLDELRRLQGIPPDWLANEELMRVVVPAVRADTRMYRNYIYTPEPPLHCPIVAYGGGQDPHISREQLDGWKVQTTASFCSRFFPGGHFFIQDGEFLQALSRDVCELLV
jgi:medium-chain acyl-[acyl-carrier-protein] hydrolase